jgi:hypothetical protein
VTLDGGDLEPIVAGEEAGVAERGRPVRRALRFARACKVAAVVVFVADLAVAASTWYRFDGNNFRWFDRVALPAGQVISGVFVSMTLVFFGVLLELGVELLERSSSDA